MAVSLFQGVSLFRAVSLFGAVWPHLAVSLFHAVPFGASDTARGETAKYLICLFNTRVFHCFTGLCGLLSGSPFVRSLDADTK
jgi:hypothetical protein